MKATIVELRYKMNRILRALEMNESVTVLYHGREKAVITPIKAKGNGSVIEHPFFGMFRDQKKPVDEVMAGLRKSRYDDI